jgi:hypothetical protein
MQESDGLTASTNFEQLLTKGSFTFNPNAGDSLKRENRRAFTVADNYQTLKQMRCAAEPAGSNYQYPIVALSDHASPTQCPVRALLSRVPLGPRPGLHRLRSISDRCRVRFVRRLRNYYGGV